MEWLAYQTITAAYNYVPQGQAQGEQPNVKEAIGDSFKKGLGGLRGGFGRKRKQPEPQPEHQTQQTMSQGLKVEKLIMRRVSNLHDITTNVQPGAAKIPTGYKERK